MPRTTPKPPIIRGLARDCDCTRQQPHGTHHSYEYHSCGCEPCRTVGTRYQKESRLLSSRGLQRRRSAVPIRRRIDLLQERGMTIREIADAAGVSFVNLHLIRRRGRDTVTTRTARAVMTVRVPARQKQTAA